MDSIRNIINVTNADVGSKWSHLQVYVNYNILVSAHLANTTINSNPCVVKYQYCIANMYRIINQMYAYNVWMAISCRMGYVYLWVDALNIVLLMDA